MAFFATSHGKGPCDGIGGTVKRLARRASLQGAVNIQTPLTLFEWCRENVENIKSFFVSTIEIRENKKQLENRFKSARPIRGTQSFHSFVPLNSHSLEARDVSYSISPKVFVVNDPPPLELIDFFDVVIGSHIACLYDGVWYLAKVLDRNEHEFEFNVHFFSPPGEQALQGFKTSNDVDTAKLPLVNVLKLVKSLKPTTRRSRTFKIDAQEREEIEAIYKNMMSNGEGEIN